MFGSFSAQLSKFDLWVVDWGLAISSKFFRDFLKISGFPKILRLKQFGNTCDISSFGADNLRSWQNIRNKVNKSSDIAQYLKTLISFCRHFVTTTAKI